MTVSDGHAPTVGTDDLPVKDRLLASATELMAERGFGGVSVRDICSHAGTSINMVHHYYGSKQGMLDAIVAQFSAAVFAVPMRLIETPPRSADDFVSRMELLFASTLDAYIEHRGLMMVVVREQANPEALPAYQEALTGFLDQAKKRGFVRAEVDSEMVVGLLLDRILNQVQMAPWIKANYGTDLLSDADYRARWSLANLDVFLNGTLA